MPSTTTLYDVMPNGTFKPKADIGPISRNSFFYGPDSHTFCIGGFGNLPGELDFYDLSTFKKVGSTESHMATSQSWSPDGRFFTCAICAPRRHIDNGFKIYNSVGALLYKEDIEELYDFVWRPDPAITGIFRSEKVVLPIPQPPEMAKLAGQGAGANGGANGGAPKKAAAYVPPHLRGKTRPAPALGPKNNGAMTMYGSNGTLLTNTKKQQAKAPVKTQGSVPFGFSPVSEPGSEPNPGAGAGGAKKKRNRKKK